MTDSVTTEFIRANANGDVRQLALQAARHPGVDMPFALDQIAGRQTARRKLPSWATVDGIVYPPRLPMEQCSGEAAALHKAAVARRLCGPGGRMVDITGGFGVDFAFMARGFGSAVYVERQERLCAIARHNLPLLGLERAEVVQADGADYLRHTPQADLVFADPARRDAAGGRTFAIADCTPDVAALRPLLLAKGRHVMIKLSPMLDWRKAVADMGGCVGEVHIVSVGGECKELLLVLPGQEAHGPAVHCVCDGAEFVFGAEEQDGGADGTGGSGGGLAEADLPGLAGRLLYEPDAAVMKAGCFGLLERRFGVRSVSANSHLFIAGAAAEGFPGRAFAISRATTMNKRSLKSALQGVAKANIAVRNFPMTVAQLRRRLKMDDGGDCHIFATTLADGTHTLLVCERIGGGKRHFNHR